MSDAEIESDPQPEPAARKPRRKRRSKAEMEAARAAQAAKQAEQARKPLDPRFWFAIGGALLIVGLCAFLDPTSFADSQFREGAWLQDLIDLLITALGKNVVALVFGVPGLLLIGWGVRVWLRQRFGRGQGG